MYEKKWPKTVEARRKRVSNYLKELRVVSRTLEDAKNSEPKNEFEHRAYQLEAWANIWEARQNGKKSALLHLATGLGKTSVAVFDVMKFRKEHADGDSERPPKVLFVCHQNNILEQAKERFAEFIPEASSQYFQTKQDKLPEADLTFGTFQSLRNELDTFPPDYFDYIIYDEAHHSQADTFSDVVEYFKPKFQLALTATPDRLDDKSITDHFGEPVYSKSLPEAMSEGWLAQVDYHIVTDKHPSDKYLEPIVKIMIITPERYLGPVMNLCQEYQAKFITMDNKSQISLIYEMPLGEMISDFYDRLKSVSSGYASLDWEFLEYREVEADKLTLLLNGEAVEEFSEIVSKERSGEKAVDITKKLREFIPRQMYEVKIQAKYKGKIIASERISPFRKDVTKKLYGGDRTRKDKLLDKQKEGKKKMKMVGRIEIPKEAFLKLFKTR